MEFSSIFNIENEEVNLMILQSIKNLQDIIYEEICIYILIGYLYK